MIRAMLGRRGVLGTAYYGGLLLVLIGILAEAFPAFLPHRLAGRISHNSEAILLALVVAGWLQFARPALAGARRRWAVVAAVAAGCAAAGSALLLSDLPSRYRTLNETFLALAVLLPYLSIRRPIPPRLAGGASAPWPGVPGWSPISPRRSAC
jgi:hypothetical protein